MVYRTSRGLYDIIIECTVRQRCQILYEGRGRGEPIKDEFKVYDRVPRSSKRECSECRSGGFRT